MNTLCILVHEEAENTEKMNHLLLKCTTGSKSAEHRPSYCLNLEMLDSLGQNPLMFLHPPNILCKLKSSNFQTTANIETVKVWELYLLSYLYNISQKLFPDMLKQ